MLIPAILVLAVLFRDRAGASAWRSVIEPRLLERLWLERPGAVSRRLLLILGLGWLLAILALAGPAWERQPEPVWRSQASRILILDLSPSMNAADLAPSRLERARFKIMDILEKSREGRTGLVIFAGEPHTVVPLTEDDETISNLLSALSTDIVPATGDTGMPALRLALELLEQAGATHGDLLLLSDGVSDPAAALGMARSLRDRGYRLSVLGVGTPQGGPVPGMDGGFSGMARLNVEPLRELARAGGGAFSLMTADDTDLQNLLIAAHRTDAMLETEGEGVTRWIEKGVWLLPLLVVMGAAGFRRGWLAGILAVLILPPPVQALDWKDLWLRQDQQAARALGEGRAEEAANRFKDPAWRGMALYSAGDYQNAARAFAGSEGIASGYNRGNALARAGQLEEAAAAYREVLAMSPGHADAKTNLALVEDLLRRQDQQQLPRQQRNPSKHNEQTEGGQQQPSQSGEGRESQQSGDHGTASSDVNGGMDTGMDRDTGQNRASPVTGDDEDSQSIASGKDTEDQNRRAGQVREDAMESVRREMTQQVQQSERATEGMELPEDSAAGMDRVRKTGDDAHSEEDQLALDQWLRQIPDDPAGLLRRKFMLEHLLRRQDRR
jgi:Ca-activated chloride channel family protein